MHNQPHDAAGPQEKNMQPKTEGLALANTPFIVGGDGRIYLNAALIKKAAVTGLKVTDRDRAAS
jgi:hypothetical protein